MVADRGQGHTRKAKKKGKNRVGLSGADERKLKAQLREVAPSEPWVEAQFLRLEDVDPKGKPIVYSFHNPRAFPPKADLQPMVECPLCLRMVPAVSMEVPPGAMGRSRDEAESHHPRHPLPDPSPGSSHESATPRCMDCRAAAAHEAYGESPSAATIRALQYRNLRLEEIKLEPESIEDLMEEIRQVKVRYLGQGPCRFLINFRDGAR